MVRVFREYERRKAGTRARSTSRTCSSTPSGSSTRTPRRCETFRERYRAFTVDEYQDVNLLQQSLLERWLGERDELCVVGDDYQSIYSFTGATPEYLLALPERFPQRDGRAPRGELPLDAGDPRAGEPARARARRRREGAAGRSARRRRARRAGVPASPAPSSTRSSSRRPPCTARACRLRGDGRPLPHQRALGGLRGGVLRGGDPVPGARRRVSRAPGGPADAAAPAPRGRRRARRGRPRRGRRAGLHGGRPRRSRERGDDAPERPRPARPARGRARRRRRRRRPTSSTDLEARFGAEAQGRGVNLLTYHRAKGLEFEAVFLPQPRRGRAAVQARRRRRGAAALLRRHDAREDAPRAHVEREAEPLPARSSACSASSSRPLRSTSRSSPR